MTDNGKISVSEDKLYRALSEFENNLKEWLAEKLERKADMFMLHEARKDISGLRDRVASLEKWRYALGLLATCALAASGVALKFLFG